MRTKHVLLVLLVALAALAVLATTASAAPGRLRLYAPTTTTSAPAVPAADLVPKTVWSIPGAGYPWVQPMWQTVRGVVVVKLPHVIVTASTQPPAWVLSP